MITGYLSVDEINRYNNPKKIITRSGYVEGYINIDSFTESLKRVAHTSNVEINVRVNRRFINSRIDYKVNGSEDQVRIFFQLWDKLANSAT